MLNSVENRTSNHIKRQLQQWQQGETGEALRKRRVQTDQIIITVVSNRDHQYITVFWWSSANQPSIVKCFCFGIYWAQQLALFLEKRSVYIVYDFRWALVWVDKRCRCCEWTRTGFIAEFIEIQRSCHGLVKHCGKRFANVGRWPPKNRSY